MRKPSPPPPRLMSIYPKWRRAGNKKNLLALNYKVLDVFLHIGDTY